MVGEKVNSLQIVMSDYFKNDFVHCRVRHSQHHPWFPRLDIIIRIHAWILYMNTISLWTDHITKSGTMNEKQKTRNSTINHAQGKFWIDEWTFICNKGNRWMNRVKDIPFSLNKTKMVIKVLQSCYFSFKLKIYKNSKIEPSNALLCQHTKKMGCL